MAILDFDKIKTTFNLYNHKPRVFTWPIVGTILFSTILFLLYKLNQYVSIWDKFKQAGGNATEFCEVNRYDQLIVQPSNTWSNLGFVIVALIILSIAKNDRKYYERSSVNNLLARNPGFSYLFGYSLLYLGLGSFFYHASLAHVFQKMDQTGMYFIIISATAYNIYKLFPLVRFRRALYSSHKLIITLSILSMLAFYLFLWRLPINITFPATVIVYFVSNYLVQNQLKHIQPIRSFITASGITLLISATLWILDRTSALCSPTSPFQGHALWHILNASSIFFAYLYFRSETFLPEEITTIATP